MIGGRRSPLARLGRLGRYLIQDAGGVLADVGYALRDALARRRPSRRPARARLRDKPRRGGA